MLLQRIAAGDSSAVAQCIDRYGNLIWSTAKKWSPTPTDAEDAVQEIFIDLWKSAGRFNPEVASEPTFVMTIARRRLIDRRRRKPNFCEPLGEQQFEDCYSREVEPSDYVSDTEDAAVAFQLLQELQADERQVLVMAVHDGLSHQQISLRTKLPLGTVKTKIRRGLLRLRDRLSRAQVAEPRTVSLTDSEDKFEGNRTIGGSVV